MYQGIVFDRVESHTCLDRVEWRTITNFVKKKIGIWHLRLHNQKEKPFNNICTNFHQNLTTIRVAPILLKIAYNFWPKIIIFRFPESPLKLLWHWRNNYWIYVEFWAFCSKNVEISRISASFDCICEFQTKKLIFITARFHP